MFMVYYRNADLFKKVAERLKDGDCVWTVEHREQNSGLKRIPTSCSDSPEISSLWV